MPGARAGWVTIAKVRLRSASKLLVRARTAAFLLVVTALGCRAPHRIAVSHPSAAAPVASGTAVAERIPVPTWMEPPLAHFQPAEWAEFFPPLDLRRPPRFGAVEVLVAGQRAALTSTAHGIFIVDAVDGISGPYDLEGYESAAFTKSSLFVGFDRGVERWRRLAGGGWSAPEPINAPKGTTGWAAGASVLAGRLGANVVVSRDDGVTFTKSTVHGKENVTRIWVRGDDVIVAQTAAGATFTSLNHGQSFARTVHVDHVEQLGDWIFGSDRTCKGELLIAALARDGRTWVQVSDYPSPSGRSRERDLESLFMATPELVALPPLRMPWADELVLPVETLPKFPGSPLCPGVARGSARRTKAARLLEEGEDIEGASDCSGVECVAQMRPGAMATTKTRAFLLHDALCEGKLGGACAPNAKLTRLPHAVFVTDSTNVPGAVREVRAVAVPKSCVPRFVAFAGGLVTLVCGGKGPTLFVATHEGTWRAEGSFAFPDELLSRGFEMLADGTATLTAYGSSPRRQWVRRPVELGVADPWRDVSRAGAVAYLPRFGGAVDVIVAEPTLGEDVFTLVEDAPGSEARTVVAHVKVGGDLWCLGRKADRLVGLRRKPSGGFQRFVVVEGKTVFDGVVLDGRGRTDPTGACGF